MPEAQEILKDDESESFRRTVELGITDVMAKVSVQGHNVVCATRGDGTVVWVDRVCKRATTPTFNAASLPFVDEAVAAWHEGQTLNPYDYSTRLLVAREAVREARAARKLSDTQKNRKILREEEAKRVEVIYLALDRTDLTPKQVADQAGISLTKLYRLKERKP